MTQFALYFFATFGFMKLIDFIFELVMGLPLRKSFGLKEKETKLNVYGSTTVSNRDLITLLEREKAKQERVKRGQISEIKNIPPPPERERVYVDTNQLERKM